PAPNRLPNHNLHLTPAPLQSALLAKRASYALPLWARHSGVRGTEPGQRARGGELPVLLELAGDGFADRCGGYLGDRAGEAAGGVAAGLCRDVSAVHRDPAGTVAGGGAGGRAGGGLEPAVA